MARRFYFNVENGGGEIKYPRGDQHLGVFDLKFGCRVVRNDFCTFDIFNGFVLLDGIQDNEEDDNAFASLTVGGNLNLYLGDRLRLQGSFELPLAGEVYAYDAKACFYLTPNIGLTAGYRGYVIKDDVEDEYNDGSNYGINDESSTSKLKGLTMGIELSF